MRALVGDSQIALEGNLATCDFSKVEDYRVTSFGELHRVDDGRESDYQVFELNSDTLEPLLEQVLSEDRLSDDIEHIQIQRNGQLQVLIGDNFHDECVSVGPAITIGLLEGLKSQGIIRSYQTDAEAKARFPWFRG